MTRDEKVCATCKHFTQLFTAGGGAGDGSALPWGECGLGVTDGEWRRGDNEVGTSFSCSKWEPDDDE